MVNRHNAPQDGIGICRHRDNPALRCADIIINTVLYIPLLKSGKRCADSRIVHLKGGQDTAHRRLLDVRKMLRHSVSFAGGLRQFIKRRFLIVQIPSQILFLFFGEIADNVFLGWQLRRRRVKAVHPALQKIPLLL